MELGEKYKNYHTEYGDSKNDKTVLETYSIEELITKLIDVELHDCKRNNLDANTIPVFIRYKDHLYTVNKFCEVIEDSLGMSVCLDITDYTNKMTYVAPDSRPQHGEYWTSRGPSDIDCSGFIVSKKAGERLLRMVKYVLDTDEPKSRLDYRDYEPDWIQFKFDGSEFDLETLDNMARQNNNIIDENILFICKL